jgi:hypothetical protein
MKPFAIMFSEAGRTLSPELHYYARKHGIALDTAEKVSAVRTIMELETGIETTREMVKKELAVLEARIQQLAELKAEIRWRPAEE